MRLAPTLEPVELRGSIGARLSTRTRLENVRTQHPRAKGLFLEFTSQDHLVYSLKLCEGEFSLHQKSRERCVLDFRTQAPKGGA